MKTYKGVVRDRDRHGNDRCYFRKLVSVSTNVITGKVKREYKKIRLNEPHASDAFETELACARLGIPYKPDQKITVEAPPEVAPLESTLDWLKKQYLDREVIHLAVSTQKQKKRVLDGICDETCLSKSGMRAGDMNYRHLEKRHVALLRDEKKKAPEAANHRIKALSAMYKWAIESGEADTNPATGVKKISTGSTGHHTWTEDEIAQFEGHHPPGTKAHLALTIFRFTGLRVCDACKFGRQHLYSDADRDGNLELRFRITPKKTNRSTGIEVDLPVLPPLQEALESANKKHLAFLITEFGNPFSEKGLGNKMRDWCDQAELYHCSSHGIRKADATIAAENGATSSELQALFGWKTIKQAEIYTRAANRRKTGSAGVNKLIASK